MFCVNGSISRASWTYSFIFRQFRYLVVPVMGVIWLLWSLILRSCVVIIFRSNDKKANLVIDLVSWQERLESALEKSDSANSEIWVLFVPILRLFFSNTLSHHDPLIQALVSTDIADVSAGSLLINGSYWTHPVNWYWWKHNRFKTLKIFDTRDFGALKITWYIQHNTVFEFIDFIF